MRVVVVDKIRWYGVYWSGVDGVNRREAAFGGE